MRKDKRGFTLLELIVVIAILAILAIVAVPNFIGSIEKSRQARDLAEINSVQKAVGMFYSDNGYVPTLQGEQPVYGNPTNIDFALLVPNYLGKFPHFSYWYVDYNKDVYHTKYPIGNISGSSLLTDDHYTYEEYNDDVLSSTQPKPGDSVNLVSGLVIKVKDENGKRLPDLTVNFKGTMKHPQSPDYKSTPTKPVSIQELIDSFDGNALDTAKWKSYYNFYPNEVSVPDGSNTLKIDMKIGSSSGRATKYGGVSAVTPFAKKGMITISYDWSTTTSGYALAGFGLFTQIYNASSANVDYGGGYITNNCITTRIPSSAVANLSSIYYYTNSASQQSVDVSAANLVAGQFNTTKIVLDTANKTYKLYINDALYVDRTYTEAEDSALGQQLGFRFSAVDYGKYSVESTYTIKNFSMIQTEK